MEKRDYKIRMLMGESSDEEQEYPDKVPTIQEASKDSSSHAVRDISYASQKFSKTSKSGIAAAHTDGFRKSKFPKGSRNSVSSERLTEGQIKQIKLLVETMLHKERTASKQSKMGIKRKGGKGGPGVQGISGSREYSLESGSREHSVDRTGK